MSRPAGPRPAGLRPAVAVLATALLAAGTGALVAGPARAAERPMPESQSLVSLLGDHVARTWPTRKAHRIQAVRARRPLTGVRTRLPVVGAARDGAGRRWLHVRLPGRPNGRTGWIRASDTRRTSTAWRISIALSARRVTVLHGGRPLRSFRAVVGADATPTPRGRFFVEEVVALPPGDAGGPFALATSARSTVLQEYRGGPGQIALHGTHGLPGALGTAASHGCIRLSTPAIIWLAERIGSGIPVTVTR
jgi:lipoprotein-anchoring transpeptidase ErfK/SrfK